MPLKGKKSVVMVSRVVKNMVPCKTLKPVAKSTFVKVKALYLTLPVRGVG